MMTAILDSTKNMESVTTLVHKSWWAYLLWVPAAALLGFAVAEIFAGLLQLPRSIYLIPYVVLVSLFLYAFVRWSELAIPDLLRHHWVWGLVGGVLVGAFTVRNIYSQPASAHAEGLMLVFQILWLGVVYGLIDALLLSVLPVLATWQGFSELGWTGSWPGKILVGFIALLASLFVTVLYHLGYPEIRQPGALFGPTLGNGVMTLGYLLTGNPLAAIISHIAMHIAGVLHGPATVIQLPPHY